MVFFLSFFLKKVMEDRIYSQAPSRFPINTAYVEVVLTSLFVIFIEFLQKS